MNEGDTTADVILSLYTVYLYICISISLSLSAALMTRRSCISGKNSKSNIRVIRRCKFSVSLSQASPLEKCRQHENITHIYTQIYLFIHKKQKENYETY